MFPYSRGIFPENTSHYGNFGIIATETVFEFQPQSEDGFEKDTLTTSDPLQSIFSNNSAQKRSLSEIKSTITIPIRTSIKEPKRKSTKTLTKGNNGRKKYKHRTSKKVNKCIIKFDKGGEEGEEFLGKKRKRRRGGKYKDSKKKYIIPLLIGLGVAKAILLKVALKFLAFLSAKGLMMGFFSTILASLIGLRGMFHYPQDSSKRNDDSKTQVEIIQVPTKSEDQHVYYDEHYKRGDTGYIPVFPPNDILVYDNFNNVLQKKSFVAQKNDVHKNENNLKKKSTSPLQVKRN